MRSRTRYVAVAALLFAVLAPLSASPAAGQDEAPKKPATPQVSIDAVKVTPDKPGAETLCRLTVTLHNHGERPMTAFGFDVTVAGHTLPVYDNQLFLKALGPDEAVDLALYNFWTSETGRPVPADGKMAVEVTLREARWLATGDDKGVEVWTLEGPVDGLPVSAKTVVALAK